MAETKAYARFRKRVSECELCPLSETRNLVVVDRGNPSAKLLFVGEAPGQTENAEGEPFVGRSGELLDELLEAAALMPDDYCITNVLKCWPPGNVFPGDSGAVTSARCVYTCLEKWFDKQFELINPSTVVLVGKKALEWVLFRGERKVPSMQEACRTWYKSAAYRDVSAWFCTYHPSYLLRTRNTDPELYEDLLKQTDKTLRRAKRCALSGKLPDGKPTLVKGQPKADKQARLF